MGAHVLAVSITNADEKVLQCLDASDLNKIVLGRSDWRLGCLAVMDLREAQRFGDDAGWEVRRKVRESRCYDQIETSLSCFTLTYREK